MAHLSYSRHRFPPAVIQRAIWLYLRFTLSYRDVEDLLAERGLEVSYETVRRWVLKFGPGIARKLRWSRPRPSDGLVTATIDEPRSNQGFMRRRHCATAQPLRTLGIVRRGQQFGAPSLPSLLPPARQSGAPKATQIPLT
jgi:hypothetical protein